MAKVAERSRKGRRIGRGIGLVILVCYCAALGLGSLTDNMRPWLLDGIHRLVARAFVLAHLRPGIAVFSATRETPLIATRRCIAVSGRDGAGASVALYEPAPAVCDPQAVRIFDPVHDMLIRVLGTATYTLMLDNITPDEASLRVRGVARHYCSVPQTAVETVETVEISWDIDVVDYRTGERSDRSARVAIACDEVWEEGG